MFGRATIRLGIGPHSSLGCIYSMYSCFDVHLGNGAVELSFRRGIHSSVPSRFLEADLNREVHLSVAVI